MSTEYSQSSKLKTSTKSTRPQEKTSTNQHLKEKELLERIIDQSRQFHSRVDRLPFTLGQLRTCHKLVLQGYNIEDLDLTEFLKGHPMVQKSKKEEEEEKKKKEKKQDRFNDKRMQKLKELKKGVKPPEKRVLINILEELMQRKKDIKIFPNHYRSKTTGHNAIRQEIKKAVKTTLQKKKLHAQSVVDSGLQELESLKQELQKLRDNVADQSKTSERVLFIKECEVMLEKSLKEIKTKMCPGYCLGPDTTLYVEKQCVGDMNEVNLNRVMRLMNEKLGLVKRQTKSLLDEGQTPSRFYEVKKIIVEDRLRREKEYWETLNQLKTEILKAQKFLFPSQKEAEESNQDHNSIASPREEVFLTQRERATTSEHQEKRNQASRNNTRNKYFSTEQTSNDSSNHRGAQVSQQQPKRQGQSCQIIVENEDENKREVKLRESEMFIVEEGQKKKATTKEIVKRINNFDSHISSQQNLSPLKEDLTRNQRESSLPEINRQAQEADLQQEPSILSKIRQSRHEKAKQTLSYQKNSNLWVPQTYRTHKCEHVERRADLQAFNSLAKTEEGDVMSPKIQKSKLNFYKLQEALRNVSQLNQSRQSIQSPMEITLNEKIMLSDTKRKGKKETIQSFDGYPQSSLNNRTTTVGTRKEHNIRNSALVEELSKSILSIKDGRMNFLPESTFRSQLEQIDNFYGYKDPDYDKEVVRNLNESIAKFSYKRKPNRLHITRNETQKSGKKPQSKTQESKRQNKMEVISDKLNQSLNNGADDFIRRKYDAFREKKRDEQKKHSGFYSRMQQDIQVRTNIIRKIEEDNTIRYGAQPPVGGLKKQKKQTEGFSSSMEHFEAIKQLIQHQKTQLENRNQSQDTLAQQPLTDIRRRMAFKEREIEVESFGSLEKHQIKETFSIKDTVDRDSPTQKGIYANRKQFSSFRKAKKSQI